MGHLLYNWVSFDTYVHVNALQTMKSSNKAWILNKWWLLHGASFFQLSVQPHLYCTPSTLIYALSPFQLTSLPTKEDTRWLCREPIWKKRWRRMKWKPHTESDPCYLHISRTLAMVSGRLNEERWRDLNATCEKEPVIPSLTNTPQTPRRRSHGAIIPGADG